MTPDSSFGEGSGDPSTPLFSSAVPVLSSESLSFFLSFGFVISLGGSMSADVMTPAVDWGACTCVSPGMPPETRKSSRRS